MTQDNPLTTERHRQLREPVNDPRRVRVFKAAQISTMPCIEKSRGFIGDEEFNLREEYSVIKDTPGKKRYQIDSKLTLAQNSTREASLAESSLPAIQSISGGTLTTRHSRKGVLGYADELFEMRMNAKELKEKHRKEVETAKFEFQKGRVTAGRAQNDFTVSTEMIGALKEYLDRT